MSSNHRFDPSEPTILSSNRDPRSIQWPVTGLGTIDLQQALCRLRQLQTQGLAFLLDGDPERAQRVFADVEVQLACLHDIVEEYHSEHQRASLEDSGEFDLRDLNLGR